MKKILSLLLTLLLVLSCGMLTTFSADESSLVSERELGVLQALGIIESADISAESLDVVMTRGEAAKYFCDILDLDIADVQGFESVFYDVSSENPYYKYIKTLFDAGYVRGDGDGRFRPYSLITAQETARVLSDIAGYKGYTAVLGLNKTIQTTDVFDGVSMTDELTLGGFLKMTYNILHAPACRAVKFGTAVEYEIDDSVAVMEEVFDVVFSKGIVDGTDKVTLKGELSDIRDGYVMIDGLAYADKTGEASELLGYSVEFYYKKGNDVNEIIYVHMSDKNSTKVLSDDVIIGYSDFTYKYDEDNKTKEVSIQYYTDVIFNGVACDTPTDEDFVPTFGQVTLVDNNGDRKYDVVFIESYEFALVKSANDEKKTVYDTNGRIFDFYDIDSLSVVYGESDYSFERILSGNLLKIKSSKTDGNYTMAEIEIIKDSLSGVAISSVTSDSITAMGNTYEIYEDIDEESKACIKVGNKVNLYVYDGVIVRAEMFTTDNYAYLLSMSQPENFDKTVKFMFVKYGVEEVIYEMADRIKIDSVTVSDPDSIRSLLLSSAPLSIGSNAATPLAQPVKYTLTKSGKLASIDTLVTNPGEDPETCLKKLDATTYEYKSSNGGYYATENEETVLKAVYSSTVFTVPMNDAFAVEKYYMANLNDNNSNVEIFDVDPVNKAAGAVFYYRNILDGGTSTPYLVLDKWTELAATGETRNVLKLAYISTVKDYQCLAEVESIYDSLEIGDLISIAVNDLGEIRGITKKFTVTTVPSLTNRVLVLISSRNSTKNPPFMDGTRFVYGTPLNVDGGNILITPSLTTDEGGLVPEYRVDNLTVGNVPIWKYETVRGNTVIEQGSMSDIVDYNTDPQSVTPIVVDIRSGAVKQIIVICD